MVLKSTIFRRPETQDKEQAESSRRPVLSVTELNRKIRTLLENQFPSLWVEGEVSNFKHHTSGHMYFSLKDDKSQISAVFFSRANQALKFKIKDGLQVIIAGRISVYEPRGTYQIYVERVEPKGMGSLQLAFLQMKEKLEKEGLFAAERKRAIPKFPHTIGIVTSPTGAAIRDILNVVQRRFHGTHILLYPVKVQGEGAAEEVAAAVEEMNRRGGIDVLIVGRGGGSAEDLWAFNEERVARAVFASEIPVISAVGHEIDWTICDLVADLRAPTPSAAAELVVQSRQEIETRLRDFRSRLQTAIRSDFEREHERLDALKNSYAFKQPRSLIQQYAQKLDEQMRQLQNYFKSYTQQKRHGLESAAGKLEALSPLKILARGYSITFDAKGSPVRNMKAVKAGDSLRTRVESGWIHSTVDPIKMKEGE